MAKIAKWLAVLAISIVLAIPAYVILINFAGIGLNAALSSYFAPRMSQEPVRGAKDTPADGKYQNVYNPKRGYALSSIEYFNEFDRLRVASIQLVLDSGLFQGSTASSKKSAARIAALEYARDECQELLKTFAEKCRVSDTSADLWTGKTAMIRFSLEFVQKGDFGTVAKSEKLIANTISFRYQDDGDVRFSLTDPQPARKKRAEIYQAIYKDCAAIKEQYGNCSIYTVSIQSDPVGKEGQQSARVSGSSSQAVIQPMED